MHRAEGQSCDAYVEVHFTQHSTTQQSIAEVLQATVVTGVRCMPDSSVTGRQQMGPGFGRADESPLGDGEPVPWRCRNPKEHKKKKQLRTHTQNIKFVVLLPHIHGWRQQAEVLNVAVRMQNQAQPASPGQHGVQGYDIPGLYRGTTDVDMPSTENAPQSAVQIHFVTISQR